ncbi:CIC11C00000004836 [Sungouiella intermedia]|uniref:CIC11C00000004836 n=1 Tax=Sungouiella intermedia TaxID=45354 RepID=A0A1L0C180_9ASCO|nr:CIC11C00000004836 [[Candida] intermedia]
MGNKASRPARKLANTVVNTGSVARSSKPQLPSAELKQQYENQASGEETKKQNAAGKQEAQEEKSEKTLLSVSDDGAHRQFGGKSGPEGKDGMDPTADKAFIDSINRLGRQIQSHSARDPKDQLNVTALKQLLNRKTLYEKGQSEVKAQLLSLHDSRSMIHPRTLTAILNAINEHKTSSEDVMKDYQVEKAFLDNLNRFKVASNVVIIEEDRKDDEIGPKMGQPRARAAAEGSMIDYDGDMSETVNQDRIKQLRKRLE